MPQEVREDAISPPRAPNNEENAWSNMACMEGEYNSNTVRQMKVLKKRRSAAAM